ncbi:MAG TPA: hypothetical protein VGB30_07825 [bacterium]
MNQKYELPAVIALILFVSVMIWIQLRMAIDVAGIYLRNMLFQF